MKKFVSTILITASALALVTGCSKTTNEVDSQETTETTAEETTTSATEDFDTSFDISVVSREDGSGTRGAFIELLGIEEKDESGEKVDYTTEEANITNSTSVMMTTVSMDKYAIGYISLGSLNETVKAIKIDGVEPSVETIKDSTYKVARPFSIATKEEISEVTQDFIDYILSTEGQKIVEENGYIGNSDTQAYAGSKPSGEIVIAGSSSVSPVMEKLKEAYLVINNSANIEIQTSDSTTGMTSAIDGICDIGMASREVKDTEIEAGLIDTKIAMDGIAIVVNNQSSVDELSSDQVKEIFIGEVYTWEEALQ